MTTAIKAPNAVVSNIEEIGRHLDDLADGDIETPRIAALRMFVDDYTNQYSELFDNNGDSQYIYNGEGGSESSTDNSEATSHQEDT